MKMLVVSWVAQLRELFADLPQHFVALATMRRRSDDENSMSPTVVYMIKLAAPFVIAALSAYGAVQIALNRSDVQISTLQEQQREMTRQFEMLRAEFRQDMEGLKSVQGKIMDNDIMLSERMARHEGESSTYRRAAK